MSHSGGYLRVVCKFYPFAEKRPLFVGDLTLLMSVRVTALHPQTSSGCLLSVYVETDRKISGRRQANFGIALLLLSPV